MKPLSAVVLSAAYRLPPLAVVLGLLVSPTAFGAEGPYAKRPGIDIIFQGESGMISITGDPKDGPRKTATTIPGQRGLENAHPGHVEAVGRGVGVRKEPWDV